jgi:hypothetical protein
MTAARFGLTVLLVFCCLFKDAVIYAEIFTVENINDQDRQQNSDSNPAVQVGKAKIAILNKITTKREVCVLNADAEVQFGSLNIKVLECWKVLDPFKPDNLALIEIYEQKPHLGRKLIFRGWMSSANPGCAVLEHYAYAVVVLECL